MATQRQQRLLTADEFLRIDFGSGLKAELDNGVIRMMAGGSARHDRIQINLIIALGARLRGSGCRPRGPDMAVRTHDGSIRYPDVSIYCGSPPDEDRTSLDDPKVLIEILSASTQAEDRGVKLQEYKALASVDTIVLADPERERLHVFQRAGHRPEAWSEVVHVEPADLDLPTLGITIPHADIFARD